MFKKSEAGLCLVFPRLSFFAEWEDCQVQVHGMQKTKVLQLRTVHLASSPALLLSHSMSAAWHTLLHLSSFSANLVPWFKLLGKGGLN